MYNSSNETALLIVQTLLTLVNSPEGAKTFVAIDDASPLIEAAPSQPLILDVFLHAYAQCAISLGDSASLRSKIDQTVTNLAVSFKGTDAVTFLGFLDQLLRRLDPEVLLPITIENVKIIAHETAEYTCKSVLVEVRRIIYSGPCDEQADSSRTSGIHQPHCLLATDLPNRDIEAPLL